MDIFFDRISPNIVVSDGLKLGQKRNFRIRQADKSQF